MGIAKTWRITSSYIHTIFTYVTMKCMWCKGVVPRHSEFGYQQPNKTLYPKTLNPREPAPPIWRTSKGAPHPPEPTNPKMPRALTYPQGWSAGCSTSPEANRDLLQAFLKRMGSLTLAQVISLPRERAKLRRCSHNQPQTPY